MGPIHDEHSRPLEQSPFYAMRPIGDITPSDPHMGAIDVFNCSVHGPRQTLHIPETYAQNHSPYQRTDNKHLYPPTDVWFLWFFNIKLSSIFKRFSLNF